MRKAPNMPERPGRDPWSSDRTTGWSGQLDWPPAQDRSRARPLPAAPETPEAEGLHKFNLGMVPASVTPPRTWRRAAWFSIASAAAVLGGLVSASTLVESPPRWEGVDLPGMPRGGHWSLVQPTGEQPDPLKAIGRVAAPPTTDRATTGRPAPGQPIGGDGLPPGGAPGTPGEPGFPGGGDVPGTSSPVPPSTPPPTSEAMQLVSFSDAELVLQRSDQYFSSVSEGDLRSAYELTTGRLRAEGFEKFSSRYAGASSIEVVEVRTDSSRTITTLRITAQDGAVHTERRELLFTPGKDPLIESDELAS